MYLTSPHLVEVWRNEANVGDEGIKQDFHLKPKSGNISRTFLIYSHILVSIRRR